MTPQEYIESELLKLKESSEFKKHSDQDIVAVIFRLIMSKKFRKYSASSDLQEQIKKAIAINVRNREPINITFPHGGYKLWRLDESPSVDWAELFSLKYYSQWVKPICEIYEPGILFDFFVDDLIVPKLNNVLREEVELYIESYRNLIKFMTNYQPKNLIMTVTTVGSLFPSEDDFNNSLNKNIELKRKEYEGLPEISDKQVSSIELNVKVTKAQLADPKWREKVALIESGYSLTKAEPGYHKDRPEKILAFVQPLPSGATISVGTTKSSIMKFWVGAGVLEHKDIGYKEIILSPNQLRMATFDWENIAIKGLNGKNFDKIRILN